MLTISVEESSTKHVDLKPRVLFLESQSGKFHLFEVLILWKGNTFFEIGVFVATRVNCRFAPGHGRGDNYEDLFVVGFTVLVLESVYHLRGFFKVA